MDIKDHSSSLKNMLSEETGPVHRSNSSCRKQAWVDWKLQEDGCWGLQVQQQNQKHVYEFFCVVCSAANAQLTIVLVLKMPFEATDLPERL